MLRTLVKMTEANPQHMAQQMTLPVLNVLLRLLDPSTQHLACKAYAAAIVMDSLSWACVTARYGTSTSTSRSLCVQHPERDNSSISCRVDVGPHAGKHRHAAALKAQPDNNLLVVACRNTAPAESLTNLFMSVEHVSILEAIHLLEHSCDFTTKAGKQCSFALLQAVTVLANRLGAMGAGSMAETNGGAAAGAASKGQHARAVVARRLANVPRLLLTLREMVQVVDRASAGV